MKSFEDLNWSSFVELFERLVILILEMVEKTGIWKKLQMMFRWELFGIC